MAFLELCKSEYFSQCSSIKFGQCYNFPKNAKQICFSMPQSFQADELFNVFVCIFYWSGRTGRIGWTGSVTPLISCFYGSSWSVCSHAFLSLCYFTFPILVIENEWIVLCKADGIWLLQGNYNWIFIFVELNLNQQTGKHIFVNRRRKIPLNSIICFLFT